jgi:hypothetical protein
MVVAGVRAMLFRHFDKASTYIAFPSRDLGSALAQAIASVNSFNLATSV